MERTLIIIRFTLALLFLWFGSQQWLHPAMWTGFLPEWTGYLPVPATMFIMLNGLVEIVGAIALILGFFVRPIVVLLGLHLLGIAVSAGGAIGVRDAALAITSIALGFSPPDKYTVDAKYK